MSLKHDVAIGTASEIEKSLAESLQGSLDERLRIQGGKRAITQVQQRLKALSEHADQLNEDGELDDRQWESIKKFMSLAHGVTESMFQTYDVSLHEQDGKIAGIQFSLKVVSKRKELHESAKTAEETRAVSQESVRFGGRVTEGDGRFGGRIPEPSEEVEKEQSEEPLPDPEELVDAHTKKELKTRAEELAVSTSGNKIDIAERIVDALQHS